MGSYGTGTPLGRSPGEGPGTANPALYTVRGTACLLTLLRRLARLGDMSRGPQPPHCTIWGTPCPPPLRCTEKWGSPGAFCFLVSVAVTLSLSHLCFLFRRPTFPSLRFALTQSIS